MEFGEVTTYKNFIVTLIKRLKVQKKEGRLN